jgi:predicted RNase H-like nuclease
VAVVLRERHAPSAHLLATIDDIAGAAPDAEVVGIDIPIGLSDDRPRQADLAARAAVGPRRSSVFVTPIRAALEAPTHAAATAISVAVTGSGVSQQAFGLRAKIFEVERWLPSAPCAVYEVHPELSFTTMSGRPPTAPKKSWHGMVERRAALAREGIGLDHIDPHVGALVGIDDLLDAAAVAWSARRLRSGHAIALPDPPERDASGRPMAIWA